VDSETTTVDLHAFVRERRDRWSVEVPEEKALGCLVAEFCRWDGDRILEVAAAALRDANFEALARRVEEMDL